MSRRNVIPAPFNLPVIANSVYTDCQSRWKYDVWSELIFWEMLIQSSKQYAMCASFLYLTLYLIDTPIYASVNSVWTNF